MCMVNSETFVSFVTNVRLRSEFRHKSQGNGKFRFVLHVPVFLKLCV